MKNIDLIEETAALLNPYWLPYDFITNKFIESDYTASQFGEMLKKAEDSLAEYQAARSMAQGEKSRACAKKSNVENKWYNDCKKRYSGSTNQYKCACQSYNIEKDGSWSKSFETFLAQVRGACVSATNTYNIANKKYQDQKSHVDKLRIDLAKAQGDEAAMKQAALDYELNVQTSKEELKQQIEITKQNVAKTAMSQARANFEKNKTAFMIGGASVLILLIALLIFFIKRRNK